MGFPTRNFLHKAGFQTGQIRAVGAALRRDPRKYPRSNRGVKPLLQFDHDHDHDLLLSTYHWATHASPLHSPTCRHALLILSVLIRTHPWFHS